jgi:hypothetical protein
MVIQETDFRMIPSGVNTHFWDLELLQTIKPRGGKERQEFKEAGYGMLFETCIERIAHYRTVNNCPDVVSLKEYFEDYIKHIKELKELCKGC